MGPICLEPCKWPWVQHLLHWISWFHQLVSSLLVDPPHWRVWYPIEGNIAKFISPVIFSWAVHLHIDAGCENWIQIEPKLNWIRSKLKSHWHRVAFLSRALPRYGNNGTQLLHTHEIINCNPMWLINARSEKHIWQGKWYLRMRAWCQLHQFTFPTLSVVGRV